MIFLSQVDLVVTIPGRYQLRCPQSDNNQFNNSADVQRVKNYRKRCHAKIGNRIGTKLRVDGTEPVQHLCAECMQSQLDGSEDDDAEVLCHSSYANLGALRVQEILLRRDTELYRYTHNCADIL